jgi:dTMP kinase
MAAFIAFEGPDGSGKSTQLRLLARKMEAEGLPVRTTREPGGTPLGERLRELLLTPSYSPEPTTELFLFEAARAELVAKVILPSLKLAQNVLSDRFAASTVAYQGYGLGLDMDIIASVNRMATQGLEPDLYILLDVPPELGLRRKRGAVNRIDDRELAFHRRVRAGYLDMASKSPGRWLVLDGSLEPNQLASQIWKAAEPLFYRTKASGSA